MTFLSARPPVHSSAFTPVRSSTCPLVRFSTYPLVRLFFVTFFLTLPPNNHPHHAKNITQSRKSQ